ncbi:hypothetical protein NLY44_32825, partial [Mesorhizobium sp. C089B]|uniref:hypothetical protein n=1 Tax=Mesorhizobium sp. C089B TaxID=2956823 RepID=UPI002574B340
TGAAQTFTDATGSLTASYVYNPATGAGTISYSYTLVDNTTGDNTTASSQSSSPTLTATAHRPATWSSTSSTTCRRRMPIPTV